MSKEDREIDAQCLAEGDFVLCTSRGCAQKHYYEEDFPNCPLCGSYLKDYCKRHQDSHRHDDCPAYRDRYAGERAVGLLFDLLRTGGDMDMIVDAADDILSDFKFREETA